MLARFALVPWPMLRSPLRCFLVGACAVFVAFAVDAGAGLCVAVVCGVWALGFLALSLLPGLRSAQALHPPSVGVGALFLCVCVCGVCVCLCALEVSVWCCFHSWGSGRGFPDIWVWKKNII